MLKYTQYIIVLITSFSIQFSIAQPTVPPGYTISELTSGGLLANEELVGIVADPVGGDVFVAAVPQNTHRGTHPLFNLYKITPGGTVSLLGNYNFRHYQLVQMEWGPDGLIYCIDGSTNTIRTIDPDAGTTSIFSTGLPTTGRHGLDFDANGDLIIMREAVVNPFFRITPPSGYVSLGEPTGLINGNHGDDFAIQPDGNYVVPPDCGAQNVMSINTAGHTDGTPFQVAWVSPTNVNTSLMPGSCVYSFCAVDPEDGDAYTSTYFSNGDANQRRIVVTAADGSGTTLFVDNALGISDMTFGRNTNNAGCNSLFFTDRIAHAVYEVPLNNCCAPQPGPVIAQGAGTFCSSTTITATGGDGGTIYFQGTDPAGISTANASTSEVVTETGTYYFRSYNSTSGCWSDMTGVEVCIFSPPPTPEISPVANLTFCPGENSNTTLSIPPVGSVTTVTYDITAADLINLGSSCTGNGNRYGTGQSGFSWTDMMNDDVSSVIVSFSIGVECNEGVNNSSLNGQPAPGFTTTRWCSCSTPSNPQNFTLTLDPADYLVGAQNTFLFNTSTTGLIPDASLDNFYAQVTVTYPTSILWSPGGETTESITVSPTTTTTYTVEVTAMGCSSSASKTITVGDNIPPTITCPDPLLLECGASTDPMTFTSDYIPGTGGLAGLLTNAGEYTVTTDPSLTHTGFAACSDHTGDAAGNMLVANGASTPNQNVYCQKVNVAPNTAYDLSVWATSVTSTFPADLQFSVDGTLVGSVFDVSGSLCTWQQMTASWSSGTSTTAEICIVNQNTIAGGNDFAIDDVSMIASGGSVNIVPNGDFNVFASASDNCDPNPVVDFNDASNTNTTPPIVEIITRTWTATTSNGGTATCDQIITIEDTTKPSIGCPNNPTVPVNASCMATLGDYTGQATADDECDNNPTVTQSPMAGTSIAVNTEVTLTATDASGNSNSCTFTVALNGNTTPALNCPPNVDVNTDMGQCGAVVTFNDPTQDCAIYLPVAGYEGPFFRDGSYYYVSTAATSWTAANAAAQSLGGQLVAIGDLAENTFVSNITGNVNELLWIGLNDIASEGVYEWTNGEPVTYFNWGSNQPDNFGNEEDYGGINFGGPGLWNDYPNALILQRFVVEICASGTPTMMTAPTAGLMSGELFPVGTTTVSFAPPACNTNITSCNFTVTVTDNEPPEALCNDVTVTLDNTGFGSTTVAAVNNSSNDACGIADISLSQSTFSCDDLLRMQFDVGGEANVLENEFALMSGPGIPLNGNGNFTPTATFGDIIVTAEATGPGLAGVRDRGNTALISRGQPRPDLLRDFLFSEAPDGEIKVTVSNLPAGTFALTTFHHDWFINFNFVNFEIYIDDANGTDQLVVPETNFHLSINPYNGESFNVVSDGMDDINIYIRATTDGRARLNGIIIESIDPITLTTLTVTDINGNSDQCTAAVTIEDNIAPNIISCPASTTVACDEDIPAANPAGVVATDNCTLQDATWLGTADNQGDGCSNNAFTRTYTYEIRDDSDNPSTCEQVITVVSNTAPTLSCPPTMVVTCIELFTPVATDAIPDVECGTATYLPVIGPTLDPGEGNNCNGATYTVTYSIDDECGRPASCTQQVAIVNNGPTIWCPELTPVECESDIDPMITDVTVETDCGLTSMIDISDPTILGQPGCDETVYQVTYKVIDACDREAMCTRSYILENEGPTITAPDDQTVECFSAIELPNVEGDDDDDDDDDGPIVGIACDLIGTVEISDPVQDGDDDCFGTTYTYTYTVTDECGRSASDEQVFRIENAGPTIDAPEDEEVTCEADIMTDANAAIVGTSCTLGSTVVVLLPPVQDGPTNCPGTKYTYTYQVTDACDRTATDVQVFTIGQNDEPTIEVVSDLTVDCFEAINPNPAWAEVTTACGNGVDYEVTVTAPVLGDGLNCPGESYTVTYTITDACDRTATAEQTYHIENEGPTMDCPDNCEVFGCYDGNAQAVIDAWINTVTATSSCSDELVVTNTYTQNGSVLNGICITDGVTPVTFTATDDCDPERTATCESLIIIMDDDVPEITGTPSELLVPCTANTDEALEAWLETQGGVSAYDECSSVSWSTNPSDPLLLLDCESGPQAIVVEFIATDECGNSSSVTGVFNTKLLPLSVNVAGLIQTEAAEAVAAVEVAAYQSSGMTAMDISDDTGDYGFEELPFEEDTEIVPSRDNDYLNGVSTYDLIVLQQHILGINELNSPYKRIAADANRSGTISTLDLLLLRRLILLIDEELEDNTSWRFVDADFVFPNPADPFETEFPEVYSLTGEEEDWASFVAVKIGDLNLDAETNSFNTGADDRSGLEDLILQIEDQKLQAGQEYEIEISSANFEAIRGFQMTLGYNHSLISVLDISGDALPEFSEANYNLEFAEQGSIPLSWNTDDSPAVNVSTKLFSLLIKANADVQLSEVLTISSSLTRAEAYGTELMNVALNFTNNGTSVTADQFQLFQNQPNPFKDATMIGFVLPEDSEVLLEIFDVNGRLIHSQRGDYAKGYQQIDLDRANLQMGVLYYQVSTANDSASKKMIVLE